MSICRIRNQSEEEKKENFWVGGVGRVHRRLES
jgi:hypothetical protein